MAVSNIPRSLDELSPRHLRGRVGAADGGGLDEESRGLLDLGQGRRHVLPQHGVVAVGDHLAADLGEWETRVR